MFAPPTKDSIRKLCVVSNQNENENDVNGKIYDCIFWMGIWRDYIFLFCLVYINTVSFNNFVRTQLCCGFVWANSFSQSIVENRCHLRLNGNEEIEQSLIYIFSLLNQERKALCRPCKYFTLTTLEFCTLTTGYSESVKSEDPKIERVDSLADVN